MSYKNLMTSEYQDWSTPQTLVDWIQYQFDVKFDLDVCASSSTAKCVNFYTVEDDAFTKIWGGNIWCNPPYNEQQRWINRSISMIRMNWASSVYCLIPARTDTKLFHDVIMRHAHAVYFIKGRVNFDRPGRASNTGSTHPSMLVIFQGKQKRGNKRIRRRRGSVLRCLDVPSAARRGKA